jgi:hypothetical protein
MIITIDQKIEPGRHKCAILMDWENKISMEFGISGISVRLDSSS